MKVKNKSEITLNIDSKEIKPGEIVEIPEWIFKMLSATVDLEKVVEETKEIKKEAKK